MAPPEIEERRSCPCTHIVALAEKQIGDVSLLRSEINNGAKQFDSQIKAYLDDFGSMRLEIKECLNSMQKSALMFLDGQHQFKSINHRIDEYSSTLSALKIEVATNSATAQELVKTEKENRTIEIAAYRETVRKEIRDIKWAVGMIAFFLLATHTAAAVSFTSRLLGVGP